MSESLVNSVMSIYSKVKIQYLSDDRTLDLVLSGLVIVVFVLCLFIAGSLPIESPLKIYWTLLGFLLMGIAAWTYQLRRKAEAAELERQAEARDRDMWLFEPDSPEDILHRSNKCADQIIWFIDAKTMTDNFTQKTIGFPENEIVLSRHLCDINYIIGTNRIASASFRFSTDEVIAHIKEVCSKIGVFPLIRSGFECVSLWYKEERNPAFYGAGCVIWFERPKNLGFPEALFPWPEKVIDKCYLPNTTCLASVVLLALTEEEEDDIYLKSEQLGFEMVLIRPGNDYISHWYEENRNQSKE